MKILLLQIDKTQDAYLDQGIGIYLKRLKNYIQLEVKSLQVSKAMRQRSAGEQKTEEARLLMEEIKPEDEVLLLDESGNSVKRLVFIIGGPYGFDDRVYQRAKAKISLSKMTFSHQMVRLFFVEQVYRAYTILRGEKYHHE